MDVARIAELRKKTACFARGGAHHEQFAYTLTPAEMNDLLDAYVKANSDRIFEATPDA